MLAFYKRCHFGACLGTLVFAVRTVVLVHHLIGDAPTAKVEPAVAFHCQLHTTLMADCLAQVVVAVAAISRECRHSDTFAHLVEHCFCHCDILAAFKSSLGIHQHHVRQADKTIVHRAACCVVKSHKYAILAE